MCNARNFLFIKVYIPMQLTPCRYRMGVNLMSLEISLIDKAWFIGFRRISEWRRKNLVCPSYMYLSLDDWLSNRVNCSHSHMYYIYRLVYDPHILVIQTEGYLHGIEAFPLRKGRFCTPSYPIFSYWKIIHYTLPNI